MFAVGLGPVAVSAFSISTMFIAVPTGVKIFNWIGTLWGGSIKFTTAMLFAVGFVAMFTIGGLSGVTHAVSPHDRQQTDTYYVVAHFHYVLFGGALFGIMGGTYYWFPKVFGRILDEKLGKIHFWLWLIGFNLTFGPMHLIGLQGMPRRIYTYDKALGVGWLNMLSTIGAFVIMVSVLVFLYNALVVTRRQPVGAPNDPWDGRTLEWTIPSPVPEYNFLEVPVVHNLDDFWHQKYTEDDDGRLVKLPVSETPAIDPAQAHNIHLPSPSYFPLIAASGFPIMAYGMIYRVWLVAIFGAIWLLGGLYAWALEPSAEPHAEHDDGHGDDPSPALVGAPSPALGAGEPETIGGAAPLAPAEPVQEGDQP
jgi:cytochrome c oxidase subunit 1